MMADKKDKSNKLSAKREWMKLENPKEIKKKLKRKSNAGTDNKFS